MTKRDIPVPTCATCGETDSTSNINGETAYLCKNCGTEMRYRPAGELLHSGSSKPKAKDYNGWVTSFSVRSSELYSSQAMFILGILILLLTIAFLWFGKIGADAALWSVGSGVFLSIIGKIRSIRQKTKTQTTLDQYPYWQK